MGGSNLFHTSNKVDIISQANLCMIKSILVAGRILFNLKIKLIRQFCFLIEELSYYAEGPAQHHDTVDVVLFHSTGSSYDHTSDRHGI